LSNAYDISESFLLRKSLVQETLANKLALVTCESSTCSPASWTTKVAG